MQGEDITTIFTSLGYAGAFHIYDIAGAGRKACYCTPCRSIAFTRELNNHGATVRHLKDSTDIVVFNWANLCDAALKILNKNFRCFGGPSYLKKNNISYRECEACIA